MIDCFKKMFNRFFIVVTSFGKNNIRGNLVSAFRTSQCGSSLGQLIFKDTTHIHNYSLMIITWLSIVPKNMERPNSLRI